MALPEGERRIWMRLLAPDDAADVIQEVPEEERQSLLALLDEAARRDVTALLAYSEDAAGGLMSPRFVRLRPDMTADEAISYTRLQAGQVETIYYAYALDANQRLLGVVSFRNLFAADREKRVRDVMRTDVASPGKTESPRPSGNTSSETCDESKIPRVDHVRRNRTIRQSWQYCCSW